MGWKGSPLHLSAVIPAPLYSSSPLPLFVIPAEAGIHGIRTIFWIPTFVGMTKGRVGMTAGASGNDGLGVGFPLSWE